MASDGFQVVPGELADVAKAFGAQAMAVQEALARFKSAWRVTGSSFGRLPNAQATGSRCQEVHDHITGDLTKMHDELHKGAMSLAASAVSYKAADEVAEFYSWLISQAREQGKPAG
jgi:hypothetical protein